MCMGLFGCCGEPPFATYKAYNTTTFALARYDDRDGGDGGLREVAISDWNDETGYTIGLLCAGDGLEVTGLSREKAVVERDADDGDRQTESTSSPLVAMTPSGGKANLIKTTADSGPFGGFWYWNDRQAQFFDLDLAQQSNIISSFQVLPEFGTDVSQVGIFGETSETASTPRVATWYDYTGTATGNLVRSGLSVTGGRSLDVVKALPVRPDSSDKIIVYGMERSGGNYYRRIWLVSKSSMTESSAVTVAGPVTAANRYAIYPSDSRISTTGRASRVSDSYAILYLRTSGLFPHPEDGTLVCVDLSGPSEAWTKSDKIRRFVAMDSTRVYTVNPTAGEISALSLSGGAEQWTIDLSVDTKLGTGTGTVFGRILSSGKIAVWRNAGAVILDTSGSEVATIDVGPVYDIVEKSGYFHVVGGKRTTSS